MDFNPFRSGLSVSREAQSFVFVIFGVTGDLTRKKLMPALFSLYAKGHLNRFKIVGFARRPWTQEFFRSEVEKMLQKPELLAYGKETLEAFLKTLEYLSSPFEDPAGYQKIDTVCSGFAHRIYYLATPPESYGTIIQHLGENGLAREKGGHVRIVVEKPFGRDLSTARRLNDQLSQYFREDQIYRIDHYLGKETVQNLILLRFGNGIFEPVWNHRYIHHIQITVAEKIGVEGRGNYYETAGALRDMVQNHMFQLLCLTTMEPPNDLNPDTIRTEKVKILKSLRPISFRETPLYTVRGQYAAGYMDGKPVPAYREEPGVASDSRTETFVALKLFLDTWRWSGVPIYLRTGKRLARRMSEIAVRFKAPPLELFPRAWAYSGRNALIIRIQPNEGISLIMNAKIPGYTLNMRPVNMDFSYGSAFGESPPEAYERLLLDALVGDSTLYTRRDEIEASWTFITRILKGWEEDPSPIPQYVPGGSGPEEAKTLLEPNTRWRKL
ncbi:MAG: glucose-6-phosphate dehydrogenase [Spirochaetes bacterium]|nr:glucose-6-phosphate dehydrogenase [Spirochaetota bacterium]